MARTLVINEQLDDIADAIREIAGHYDVSDYRSITAAIRAGNGDKIPNGTIFTVPHTVYGNIRFVVRAHNQHKVAGEPTRPTITIQMADLLSANGGTSALALQYDRPEAMCKVEEAIPAGTVVKFTSVVYSSWAAGTWHFTTAQEIPVGAMICLNHYADTALDSCSVQVYTTAKDTSPAQTLALASGDGGATVNLGTWADDMNHPHRISYGSNNEAESNLFAWLNTDGLMSDKWAQKTKYDMLGTSYPSMQGFLGGFPADFRNCLGLSVIPNITNTVFEAQDSETEVNSAYTHNGYFFLPSEKEIYGTNETASEADEVQFDYFKDIGVTNADKLMYAEHAVSPTTYWLRTPNAWNASHVRVCYPGTGGALDGYYANASYALAPLAILA